MIKIFSLAAAFSSAAAMSTAAPMQWTTGTGANGHWYDVIFAPLNWADARAAALASTHMGMSGYLASITSAEEQAFLNTLNPNNTRMWLGGTDNETDSTEGSWVWVDGPENGALLSGLYENWGVNEPNNLNNEDGLVGWWSGTSWNDHDVSFTHGYVIEYSGAMAPVPLPAAGALLLAGLGGLAAMRRRRSH